jgi:hypothetical protein
MMWIVESVRVEKFMAYYLMAPVKMTDERIKSDLRNGFIINCDPEDDESIEDLQRYEETNLIISEHVYHKIISVVMPK